jgi:cytochrome b561
MNTDDISASPARYGAVARLLHWLVALLIVFVFALGLSVDAFPHEWEDGIVLIHKDAGVAIVVLALLRLAWRQAVPPPAAVGEGTVAARLAFLGHVALYVLMVAVPVIGIALSVLRGQGFDFGLFSIPPLMEANRPLARSVKEVHELAAWALVLLAGAHALVALFHHYVLKDGVLMRMMPPRTATQR